MPEPRVHVVVVSYDTCALTLEALDSVRRSRGVRAEVTVVDNGSTDGSVEAIRARFPEVEVLDAGENLGFGRANNLALERGDAPWVLLLNSDARFADGGGLARLVEHLRTHPRTGVAGPRLESPEGRLEFSARAYPRVSAELLRGFALHRLLPRGLRERVLAGEFRDHGRAGAAEWLTGACLLVRRAVLAEVGGFDPAIFLYGEELDWCWRVGQAGWGLDLVPDVRVVHRRGASGRQPVPGRMRLAMAGDAYVVRKHAGRLGFGAFCVARSLGLGAEALLQSALGTLARDRARRARAAHAWSSLRAWWGALAAGGHRDPGALRPPPRAEGEDR